jgi:hypothetical protein
MSQHEAVATKHDQTSGVRPFDTKPIQGHKIKQEGGVKPFIGYLYHFRGHGPFTWRLSFPATPAVGPDNAYAVSITEVDRNDPTGRPFIGNAGMSIGNVAPGDGIVDVHGLVDYDTDLNYRIAVVAV